MSWTKAMTGVIIPFVRPQDRKLNADTIRHNLDLALGELTCDPPSGSTPETYAEACTRIDHVFATRMLGQGSSSNALAATESLKRQLKDGLQRSLGLIDRLPELG